jgi:hypothetical protein
MISDIESEHKGLQKTSNAIKNIYTIAFKKEIVGQIEQGQYSFDEAMERYQIARRNLNRWTVTYGTTNNLPVRLARRKDAYRRMIVQRILSSELTLEEASRQSEVCVGGLRSG